MGFASKTTNLLSSSAPSGIGEAPQLSSTYAEYDDGANVFNYYTNFAGTSLPSGWVSGENIGYTVNNGIEDINVPSGSGNGYVDTSATYTTSNYVDWYGYLGSENANQGGGGYTNSTALAGFGFWNSEFGLSTYNGVSAITSMSYTASTYAVFSTTIQGSTAYELINYGSSTSTTSSVPSGLLNLGWSLQTLSTQGFYAYWLRTRAYPPNGVMPSVSFGAVQAPVSLSISPNPATYGQSITITATCVPNTDTCTIDYPSLGKQIATGTGSATYTYAAYALQAGTYSSFYANDTTLGL